MPSDRPDSQELKYPPVRVNRSLAQLDLNTLIMRSEPHRAAHEATSLEDSTYEVLDHPADLSDDDGHTASVASTSPDDISVTLSETESEGEGDFSEHITAEASHLADSSVADPLEEQVVAAGEDSTLTERPSLNDSESGFHFKMDERRSQTRDGRVIVEGFNVVKEFTPEQSSSKVLEPYGYPDIRLTVRASLVDRFYPDRGTFRVLYVGRLDSWSEEQINTSLLNALLASPGSSKSVMVHGQMEPYSPVLHTDHCTNIQVQYGAKTPSRTIFTLDGGDGTQLALNFLRKQQDVNPTSLPDLVIFCYPKSSTLSLAESKLAWARQAFELYGIPCLDITDHRRFNEEQPGYKCADNARALRVCVEGTRDGAEYTELDTLPVDVYTFMHLDPADLNRHLAAISPHLQPAPQSNHAQKSKPWNFGSLVPTFVQQSLKCVTTFGSPCKLVLAVVAMSGLITAAYFGAWVPQFEYDTGVARVAPSVLTNSLTSSLTSPLVAATSDAAPSKTFPTVKEMIEEYFAKQREVVMDREMITTSVQKSLDQYVELSKEADTLRPTLEKTNAEKRRQIEEATKNAKSGGFEIQTSGNQQFMLRPSRDFLGRTRKPQLQIQVSRGSKTVPIRYERGIDGVYTVELEKEYPVGYFNVSIATHSKPLMQQSFNISLGHNKTRVEQWLSHLKRESSAAQQHLGDVTSHIGQQLQKMTTRMSYGTDWKATLDRSRHDLTERLHEATQEMDRHLVEARDQTWTSLRKATAPVRTSRRTLWARNNAYVLRCGFERAVGLSSKDEHGKKTRSCEAANW